MTDDLQEPTNAVFLASASSQPEPPLRTAGEAARELHRSVTTIKLIAKQIHAPVLRTPGGQWLFPAPAVEKLRQEIMRREQEGRL